MASKKKSNGPALFRLPKQSGKRQRSPKQTDTGALMRFLTRPRVCHVCGVEAEPGPLGFLWDTSFDFERLTCSPECRKQKGIPERKLHLLPDGLAKTLMFEALEED